MMLRVVVRGLVRTPAFTVIAICSLALGIGANTAIFSLLDQVLLRMLPVANPRELVFLYSPGVTPQGHYSSDESGGASFSYQMFRDLQKSQTPFTGIGASRQFAVNVAYNGNAIPAYADTVSANYFQLLGVHATLGRVFREDDDRVPGERAVAVLSYATWVSQFGGEASVLNQKLLVNGYPFTVVGVAQKGFASEKPGDAPDVFIPITMRKQIMPAWDGFDNRKDYWVTMFARLKRGVTLEQAQAAINVIYHGEIEEDAQLLSRPSATMLAQFRAKKVILKPGEHGRGGLYVDSREPALLLMGMTALVLLICCSNVANLQLARAAARSREIAVRLAIGASRWQVVRQLLTESCLLAICGGTLGLAAAWVAMRGMVAQLPERTAYANVLSPNLDFRALLFCLTVSILTGFLFGLFPASKATRPDVNSALKDQSGQSTSSGSSNGFRKMLVTAQVAISLLLLISAGLFARTLINLRNIDLGLRTDHLLTFSVDPTLNRYTDRAAYQFYDQVTERLAAIPGITLVSAGRKKMLADDDSSSNISVPGYIPPTDDASDSYHDEVGAGYFRTLGIPLIVGREFTVADNAAAPKVAIVNEEFARHFLSGEKALGHHFGIGAGVAADIEIIGVVKDAKYNSPQDRPRPVFFLPYRQDSRQSRLYFYLRTSIDPEQVASAVRHEVVSVDPNVPIRPLRTMDEQIDRDLFSQRMLSAMTAIFAALATLLAALGLYGVLAYNIARRTREIGIRMALGASAGRVRGLVLREVAVMVLIGAAAGLASAAAAGRLVENLLYGLKAWDPVIYLGATLLMCLIGLTAAYVPARRATSVDPLEALRHE